jgi:protein tyrosine phosphatase (PTP) superfamily phosphohydrolase (DUF442 family)
MLDQHASFREELKQVDRFVRAVRAHRDRVAAYSPTTPDSDHALEHISLAFEDIPEDVHETVRVILMHPTEDASLRDRVIAILENVGGGGWGEIEASTSRLPFLHILSSLSFHAPYTYRVDGKVIRGSRPSSDKLRRLYDGGVRATVNLCREMPDGDSGLISGAGLERQMDTRHIQITDNTPPDPDDVDDMLSYLAKVDGSVYVHCEAGVGRTGVMVGCYRMACGWTLANAMHEARQFGCAMPDQVAFIEDRARAVGELESAAPQPGAEVLRETATMNKDPIGLDRALA